jgi:hypothetical protein
MPVQAGLNRPVLKLRLKLPVLKLPRLKLPRLKTPVLKTPVLKLPGLASPRPCDAGRAKNGRLRGITTAAHDVSFV